MILMKFFWWFIVGGGLLTVAFLLGRMSTHDAWLRGYLLGRSIVPYRNPTSTRWKVFSWRRD